MKTTYLIVQCYGCGQFILSKSGTKTRTCPFCGLRLRIRKAKVLARTRDARMASIILKAVKSRAKSA